MNNLTLAKLISLIRQFLVAFQDSSLVVVPADCKDVAGCERSVWPKQPLKLQSSDGKSASVYCEGGFVCVLTLSEEGTLPAAPRYEQFFIQTQT